MHPVLLRICRAVKPCWRSQSDKNPHASFCVSSCSNIVDLTGITGQPPAPGRSKAPQHTPRGLRCVKICQICCMRPSLVFRKVDETKPTPYTDYHTWIVILPYSCITVSRIKLASWLHLVYLPRRSTFCPDCSSSIPSHMTSLSPITKSIPESPDTDATWAD